MERKGGGEGRREKNTRQGAYIRGFHWSRPPSIPRGNSRFHGGERKRFIGSVRTRKVSQPTNELSGSPWMNQRDGQREREKEKKEGSKDFSEA